MQKKLILVTSPPASGKTYISKLLAKRLKHVVYLDKDTLITLSKHIFAVAGQPFDRSSDFFELEYILNLKDKLSEKNANLVVVWVDTSPEVVHERMILRNSERDTWKLAHWDEYLAECNFNIPSNLDDPKIKDDLLIIKNDNQHELEASMKEVLDILEDNV